MEYLYARISKPKQNLQRQIKNLKEAFPNGTLIEEAYTGTKLTRPKWSRLYSRVKAGDMIAFDSVSRMSRNAEEGFTVWMDLYNRGVELVFLKEPHINTAVYREKTKRQIERITGTGSDATDKLINAVIDALQEYSIDLARDQIRLAFEQSEKEVSDLHQRTKEGLRIARENGKHPGPQKGQTYTVKKKEGVKEKIRKLSKDFDGHNNDGEVMAITGIAKNTYYKYKAELREELASE